MRPRFTDEDEELALEMALDGLGDEARAHRLGDRMPEGHRSGLVITIAPDGGAERDPIEELDDEDDEVI